MITKESANVRHSVVLCHILHVMKENANHHLHSPTIEELSSQTGYTEENILESMEFGHVPANTLLQ
ncbi:hypothetical protein [Salisediminibacterium beveridgei]|uniref:Uncharacterized protein n=1 Tax=Salisediminibacterium beveridgei TaxID=632773 RepID=A0A1D7QUL9_9BACI|nr:hypothetical protein [Salisediminibacterium beveridgei]AOM82697.1 hypothetical protein BBEV_1334 [Salisediminibacterium beveridgei]